MSHRQPGIRETLKSFGQNHVENMYLPMCARDQSLVCAIRNLRQNMRTPSQHLLRKYTSILGIMGGSTARSDAWSLQGWMANNP